MSGYFGPNQDKTPIILIPDKPKTETMTFIPQTSLNPPKSTDGKNIERERKFLAGQFRHYYCMKWRSFGPLENQSFITNFDQNRSFQVKNHSKSQPNPYRIIFHPFNAVNWFFRSLYQSGQFWNIQQNPIFRMIRFDHWDFSQKGSANQIVNWYMYRKYIKAQKQQNFAFGNQGFKQNFHYDWKLVLSQKSTKCFWKILNQKNSFRYGLMFGYNLSNHQLFCNDMFFGYKSNINQKDFDLNLKIDRPREVIFDTQNWKNALYRWRLRGTYNLSQEISSGFQVESIPTKNKNTFKLLFDYKKPFSYRTTVQLNSDWNLKIIFKKHHFRKFTGSYRFDIKKIENGIQNRISTVFEYNN